MTYQKPNPEIQGWMSDVELEWLYTTAQQMQSIVEVGSWRGRSTHALLSGCPGTVIAVDHFQGSPSEKNGALGDCHTDALTQDIYAQFLQNVGHFGSLQVLHAASAEAAAICGPVDMVFIDAEHTKESALNDFQLWYPKATRLFCGHDVGMSGVAQALKEWGVEYKQVFGTSIWTVWKNA